MNYTPFIYGEKRLTEKNAKANMAGAITPTAPCPFWIFYCFASNRGVNKSVRGLCPDPLYADRPFTLNERLCMSPAERRMRGIDFQFPGRRPSVDAWVVNTASTGDWHTDTDECSVGARTRSRRCDRAPVLPFLSIVCTVTH